MKRRRWFGQFAVAIAVCVMLSTVPGVTAENEDAPGEDGWVKLFNGKNLDGWTPKIRGYECGENFGKTFRVEDGLLKVSYDQYEQFDGKFGHLFYKDKFSHYILRVEYRFVGEQTPGGPGWAKRNSGIMIHSQHAKTMRKDQNFPVSIEVQLLGGTGSGNRPTLNLCTPGTNVVMNGELVTRHCNSSKSKTYHGDQWVTAQVEVHGNEVVRHVVNGETVLEYEKPQLDERDADARKLMENGDKMLHEGYICLQAESHPVEFRRVEILRLDGPKVERSKAADGFVPLFNGENLDGWEATGNALWMVENGMLVGTQGEDNAPGDLFTKASYGDFELLTTWRAEWPCNSGVWFRFQSPRKAYQADILEWKNPVCWSGTLYCPGKMFLAMNTDESLVNRDGWNDMKIRAVGDSLKIWLNGKQVANVTDKTTDSGKIGIQVHPGGQFGPMKIVFREMLIKPLD